MKIDWQDCDLVETIPGKASGKPVVKGARIPADLIVRDEELGASPRKRTKAFRPCQLTRFAKSSHSPTNTSLSRKGDFG